MAEIAGAVFLLIFLLVIAVLVVVGVLWVGAAAVTVISGGAMLKGLLDAVRERARTEDWDEVEEVLERHGAEIKRREGKVVSVFVDPDEVDAILSELDELGYDAHVRAKDG